MNGNDAQSRPQQRPHRYNGAGVILGDSFTEISARDSALVHSDVVVIEVVEREIVAGDAQFLNPSLIIRLPPLLATHPKPRPIRPPTAAGDS